MQTEGGGEILFTETKVSEADIDQSNLILINGMPLDAVLPQTTASESSCCSCGELTGREESCRTIVRHGQVYEAIPQEFIREAICKIGGCC